jgi:hypothetical protein
VIQKVSLKKSLAADHCNGDLGSFIPLFKSGKFSSVFQGDISGLAGSVLSSWLSSFNASVICCYSSSSRSSITLQLRWCI